MSRHTETIVRVLRKENKVAEEMSIWFSPSTEARAFHCPTCGAFMFYHQHRIIAMVQDDMSQVFYSPPFSIQCQKDGMIVHTHIM